MTKTIFVIILFVWHSFNVCVFVCLYDCYCSNQTALLTASVCVTLHRREWEVEIGYCVWFQNDGLFMAKKFDKFVE